MSERASGKLLLVEFCLDHFPLTLKFQSLTSAKIHTHPMPSYENLATQGAHITPLLGSSPPHGELQPTAAYRELWALCPFRWGENEGPGDLRICPQCQGLAELELELQSI